LAPPAELVAKPADAFVASFTGANLLRGTARRGDGVTIVRLETGEEIRSPDPLEGEVGVVVYPWEVALGGDDAAENVIRGEVHSLVQTGNRLRVRVGPLVAEVTAASVELT